MGLISTGQFATLLASRLRQLPRTGVNEGFALPLLLSLTLKR